MIGVVIGIYTTVRIGLVGHVSGDVEQLLGRPPTGIATFVWAHRHAWQPRYGRVPARLKAGAGVG
jgi:hypothetical protein